MVTTVRLLKSCLQCITLQHLLEGFIQDDLTTQYTPQRHFPAMDENLNQEGDDWVDLVASLEKRYASTNRVAEGDRNERPLESHPTIASAMDKITHFPTSGDYPLWRVRCKVILPSCQFRVLGS